MLKNELFFKTGKYAQFDNQHFLKKGKKFLQPGKCTQLDNQHRLDMNGDFRMEVSVKTSPRVVSTTMMERIKEIESTNFFVVRR